MEQFNINEHIKKRQQYYLCMISDTDAPTNILPDNVISTIDLENQFSENLMQIELCSDLRFL